MTELRAGESAVSPALVQFWFWMLVETFRTLTGAKAAA
jgi:hypothetical protein